MTSYHILLKFAFLLCFVFVQKKTADDFVASNDEESDDEGEVGVDEEGNEKKKPKVKKEKKRWVLKVEWIF